ncbi:MAG: YeeE/YedE family protein [Pseudomonadales bacterium]|nr:YeeE/YedE family protein [Pseudomonadales bacterium]NRA17427.1 YeeE/YedE family protein [Oceanospirillaceae bacterium]
MIDAIIELVSDFEATELMLYSGLVIGLLFGALAQKSSFCFRMMIVDLAANRSSVAATMFFAALSLAIMGSQWIFYSNQIELQGIIPLLDSYSLGAIVLGGLMFGTGMILAGGCTGRHLVLAAEGSARSWFVLLIIAISAYATLRGILALGRIELNALGNFDLLGAAGDPLQLTQLFTPEPQTQFIIGLSLGAAMLTAVLLRAFRRRHISALSYGLAIGALVPLTWLITGVIAFDEFEPVPAQSLSFVAPVANGLQFLMTYTGSSANFSTTLIAGVLLGAFVLAKLSGKFSFRGFHRERDIIRYCIGATLMGFGGVTALGCTIGQGLSGISLLSISSIIATLAISSGGFITAKLLAGTSQKHSGVASSV